MSVSGYMRLSRLTPREPQEAALRAVGFTDFSGQGNVWIDVEPPRRLTDGSVYLPRRTRACSEARSGDVVVVASLDVWARSAADGLKALAQLVRNNGGLLALDTGKTYRSRKAVSSAAAGAALEFLADMQAAVQRAETAPARHAAVQRKRLDDEATASAWARAEELWKDAAKTPPQVAEATGIHLRRLYRRLGPKVTAPISDE